MEQLAQQEKIKEKVYGKQKIYFADQEQFPTISDPELKQLDAQVSELNSQVQSAQLSCQQLETELKELNSSMTTEDMMREIKDLKEECSKYQQKLDKMKSAANHVTPEEKEKVYSERKQFCKEWKKRKRMATDIFDAILEGYPKSKKQFFEEVGVETDEDYNVSPPDI
ncbi:homologous-pairing protein 2 homolog isoform X2 [Hyperolius riggenbachi]